MQRASQKHTVQQLVMTGGHVQDDLLAPEDVVSLLLDDAQLEQKLRDIPLQVRFICGIDCHFLFKNSVKLLIIFSWYRIFPFLSL